MGNDRTQVRRRDSNVVTLGHRTSTPRDKQTQAPAAVPMLDWPSDLFSRPDASARDSRD